MSLLQRERYLTRTLMIEAGDFKRKITHLESDLAAARAQSIIYNNGRRIMGKHILANPITEESHEQGVIMGEARSAANDDSPHTTPWLNEAISALAEKRKLARQQETGQ